MRYLYLLALILLSSEALAECPCDDRTSAIPENSEVVLTGTVLEGDAKHVGWIHHGYLIRIDHPQVIPQRVNFVASVPKDGRLCEELEKYLAERYHETECSKEAPGTYTCPESSLSQVKYAQNCANGIEERAFTENAVVIDSRMMTPGCEIKFEIGQQYSIRARRYPLRESALGASLKMSDIAERWTTSVCYGTKKSVLKKSS